jgi:hypothetical protein
MYIGSFDDEETISGGRWGVNSAYTQMERPHKTTVEGGSTKPVRKHMPGDGRISCLSSPVVEDEAWCRNPREDEVVEPAPDEEVYGWAWIYTIDGCRVEVEARRGLRQRRVGEVRISKPWQRRWGGGRGGEDPCGGGEDWNYLDIPWMEPCQRRRDLP